MELSRRRQGITIAHIERALTEGTAEVIEDYPDDPRGASCLIRAEVDGRVLHVFLGNPPEPFVITSYWPDARPEKWSPDYRRRL